MILNFVKVYHKRNIKTIYEYVYNKKKVCYIINIIRFGEFNYVNYVKENWSIILCFYNVLLLYEILFLSFKLKRGKLNVKKEKIKFIIK
jgi:hypothetical protein